MFNQKRIEIALVTDAVTPTANALIKVLVELGILVETTAQ